MRKNIVLFVILCMSSGIWAQGDFYDNSGKIYTVVAVVLIVLTGIGLFLAYLDRRLTKLEKTIQDERS